MISRRIQVALIAAPASFALAACASTTNGTGSNPSGTAPATSSSSTSPSSSSSAPTTAGSSAANGLPSDAKGLFSAVLVSEQKLTSEHIEFDASYAGEAIQGVGDQRLRNGKTIAMRYSETVNGIDITFIVVGGKAYAKVPGSLNTTGKPYLLISKNSSNATIRQIATSLDSSLSGASTSQFALFLQAADDFKQVGPVTVNGQQLVRYDLTMNPSKLPPSYSGRATLVATGITSIPVQMDFDSKARLAAAVYKIQYQGKEIDVKITASRFNVPVNITAPPASQVGVK